MLINVLALVHLIKDKHTDVTLDPWILKIMLVSDLISFCSFFRINSSREKSGIYTGMCSYVLWFVGMGLRIIAMGIMVHGARNYGFFIILFMRILIGHS